RYGVVYIGAGIGDPELEGGVVRVRADAPVEAALVGDDIAADQEIDIAAIVGLGGETGRHAGVGPAAPEYHTVGGEAAVLRLVIWRAGGECYQVREEGARRIQECDPVEARRDTDMDVHPEVVLVAGDAAIALEDQGVTASARGAVLLPAAEGVGPGGGDLAVECSRRDRGLEAEASELRIQFGGGVADPGADLQGGLLEFGPEFGAPAIGE